MEHNHNDFTAELVALAEQKGLEEPRIAYQGMFIIEHLNGKEILRFKNDIDPEYREDIKRIYLKHHPGAVEFY